MTSDYHEDEKTRLSGERHAGLVIRRGKILMIHRIKNGLEYYVFPGGHRRTGETGKETVEREIKEETGVEVNNIRKAFSHTTDKAEETYYYCDWVSGETPRIQGEENVRNSKENFYEPMWVDLAKVGQINTLPEYAKVWAEKNLK